MRFPNRIGVNRYIFRLPEALVNQLAPAVRQVIENGVQQSLNPSGVTGV